MTTAVDADATASHQSIGEASPHPQSFSRAHNSRIDKMTPVPAAIVPTSVMGRMPPL